MGFEEGKITIVKPYEDVEVGDMGDLVSLNIEIEGTVYRITTAYRRLRIAIDGRLGVRPCAGNVIELEEVHD